MPYVNVPNDLSKIKTKMAFNLTKRQLICFGGAAAIGIPSYLLAMYEKDGLPFEKVVHNIIRAKFLRPGVRHYQTENIYAPFTGRGAVRKENAIAKGKKQKQSRKG